jgi:pimeloyl-ACP methyl ester carboxylesterase
MILEAPAPKVLPAFGRTEQYDNFRAMTQAYFEDFADGNPGAISRMIDFYGGPGTYASWPEAVRAYVSRTTPTNILDWQSAYALDYDPSSLADLDLPVSVVVGGNSHPAVKKSNSLVAEAIPGATFATIIGASHFMIATHPKEVARLIVRHASG